MIVVVHLNRTELTFVYNVRGAQRTNVEPVRQTDTVRGMLPQHVQLTVKKSFIECAIVLAFLRCPAVVVAQDNKRL